MEIYDFAHLILFSPELEAKLFAPARITDSRPGEPLSVIPNQPARLRLPDVLPTTQFPTDSQLKDPLQRGIALHAFVNHELLALELMALMLLRFPNAPSKFRQSLVSTMVDEQAHCRLYLNRMRHLGVEYGSVSQNFYFWNELHKVQSPFEFVTGMSLCFEQANLDFSLHFRRQFEQLQDIETAEIMRQVYEDELNHVRTGLAWFRKWRDPGYSDWQAFVKALPGNLSPIRGKGKVFDVKSRELAGFDREFTEEMTVYSRSRGRRPSLFVFFPNSEAELNDLQTVSSPNSTIEQLRTDLETCLHPISGSANSVLVSKLPSIQFRLQLHDAGFEVPDFVTRQELETSTKSWRPSAIRAWSVCPSTIAFAKSLNSNMDSEWTTSDLQILQKVNAKSFAHQTQTESDPDYLGLVCEGEQDAILSANSMLACHSAIVLKSNHASSGQGNRIVRDKLDPASRSWLSRLLEHQSCVIIEPWLNKIMDFSIHAHIRPDGKCAISGITPFLTTSRGQYAGSLVGPKAMSLVAQKLGVMDRRTNQQSMTQSLEKSALISAEKLYQAGYFGPFSQDALVFAPSGDSSALKIRSLVEINARISMGRLAYEVGKHVHPSSVGLFYLVNPRLLQLTGKASPRELAEDLGSRQPLDLSSNQSQVKQIRQGAIWLTDPYTSSGFMIVLLVGNDISQLKTFYPEACRFLPDWLLTSNRIELS